LLELHALEKKLKELDAKDDQADETRYRLHIGEHCDGWDTTQKDLIDKIASKLSEYGKQNPCCVDVSKAPGSCIH
jgi:hypothetical protein